MSFQETLSSPPWGPSLAARGILTATAVQTAVWEPFRSGRDLTVQSGTGTGKTLAYLLPLLLELDAAKKDLQALILVPTQELAVQILRQIEAVTPDTGIRSLGLLGGVNLSRQVEQLKSKPHLAVGTPGRLLELLEKKKITGHFINTVILDEADRLLDASSVVTIRAILKTTLKTRRTALFSASIPTGTEMAAREFLRDPVAVRIDAAVPVPEGIEHWFFRSELREKTDLLRKLIHAIQPGRTLVFLNKPEQIEMLADKLRHHGLKAESLHGSRFKQDRQRALADFGKGSVEILVASDLAARGLDIAQVTHVVHYDLPEDPLDYQHRCGRTGRAGGRGVSLSMADEVEETRLPAIEKALGISFRLKGIRQGSLYDPRS